MMMENIIYSSVRYKDTNTMCHATREVLVSTYLTVCENLDA